MVTASGPFVQYGPAAVRGWVLEAGRLVSHRLPTPTPTDVASVRVVLQDEVIAGAFDVEIEAPVGVMAMIVVALKPGAVQAGADPAMIPENPAMCETVGANPVVGLHRQATYAVADVSVYTDARVRAARGRLGVVVVEGILIRPARATVLDTQGRQAGLMEHFSVSKMHRADHDAFFIRAVGQHPLESP